MKLPLFYTCIFLLLSCSVYEVPASNSSGVDHSIWDTLLSKHVDDQGWVDYNGFVNDKTQFEEYLNLLSTNAPTDKWSNNEKLAYWINAYNAFTVKLIADNYPVKGIRELGPKLSIPAFNTVWHKNFFSIGGVEFNLDRIEHQILRKEFNEPRIHFAIVCASISCPKLLNKAFVPDQINEQLAQQAREFLADRSRNIISENALQLSKIFSWFEGDFSKEGTLIEFLNRYAPLQINQDAKVSFLKYNWELNDQKAVNE